MQLQLYNGYSDSAFFKQIFGSWENLANKTKTDFLSVWNIWSLKAGIGFKLDKADFTTSHLQQCIHFVKCISACT